MKNRRCQQEPNPQYQNRMNRRQNPQTQLHRRQTDQQIQMDPQRSGRLIAARNQIQTLVHHCRQQFRFLGWNHQLHRIRCLHHQNLR